MKIISKMIYLILYAFSGIIPKCSNRIIIGSWLGKRYDDNSKYLFEYLLNNKYDERFEIIWIGNVKPDNESLSYKFIKKGTMKSYYYIITSKFAFMTQGYTDFCKYNILNGCIKVQLWHGIPIKKIGKPGVKLNNLMDRLRYVTEKYNYFISSSLENKKVLLDCFAFQGANKNNILQYGQPRNDYLIKSTKKQEYLESIKLKHNIPIDKKIVTYMPTWRNNDKFISLLLDKRVEQHFLNKDYFLIEKPHPLNVKEIGKCNFGIKINNEIPTQELLAITDILITDYSSVYLDFMLTNRKVIFFVYDYEYYLNEDKGFFYNYDDIICGIKAFNVEQLIHNLEQRNEGNISDKYNEIKEMFLKYENGESCKNIVDTILNTCS